MYIDPPVTFNAGILIAGAAARVIARCVFLQLLHFDAPSGARVTHCRLTSSLLLSLMSSSCSSSVLLQLRPFCCDLLVSKIRSSVLLAIVVDIVVPFKYLKHIRCLINAILHDLKSQVLQKI